MLPWIRRNIVQAMIMLLVGAMLLALPLMCGRLDEGRTAFLCPEDRCRRDCESYGAEYVRVTQETAATQYSQGDYSCWCSRRNEPLRVW